MEENVVESPVAAQASGEGTTSGPAGNTGSNKTPLIAGVVVLLVLLTGGVLFIQNKTSKPSVTPTPVQHANRPLKMETFDLYQAQHPVTLQNVEDMVELNQLESQYGLDQSSVNSEVIDIFTDAF